MDKPDNTVYLRHIIDAMNAAERYCKDVTIDDFLKDDLIQSAACRQLEIIGEATAQLPSLFKQQYTEISWNMMSDMRNKLIHGYFGVNYSVVWTTIKEDVPLAKKQIETLLNKISNEISTS